LVSFKAIVDISRGCFLFIFPT